MLQHFDERADGLTIVASRGFSSEALTFLAVARSDTITTCAAALMRRMRVIVEDISTSYLFVGRSSSICCVPAALTVQSTPFISSKGHLWGVFTTHFHQPQLESEFDHAPPDRGGYEFNCRAHSFLDDPCRNIGMSARSFSSAVEEYDIAAVHLRRHHFIREAQSRTGQASPIEHS
ncbi:hypothetical protein BSZ19_24460 [Bradyrhizobium japonicum]|uniref:GAF domain-containing protein n=1 Tax=Bradyrhizobium japonicum TaxID=375 RepID=A0A1Y2JNE1_BRAJP|nr:hypothetical protein [Bradyrhizobium japonicum]OSJ30373.1 hypothetical protein BSZ19_24460 [Bradyrhizobium japonicum]